MREVEGDLVLGARLLGLQRESFGWRGRVGPGVGRKGSVWEADAGPSQAVRGSVSAVEPPSLPPLRCLGETVPLLEWACWSIASLPTRLKHGLGLWGSERTNGCGLA